MDSTFLKSLNYDNPFFNKAIKKQLVVIVLGGNSGILEYLDITGFLGFTRLLDYTGFLGSFGLLGSVKNGCLVRFQCCLRCGKHSLRCTPQGA